MSVGELAEVEPRPPEDPVQRAAEAAGPLTVLETYEWLVAAHAAEDADEPSTTMEALATPVDAEKPKKGGHIRTWFTRRPTLNEEFKKDEEWIQDSEWVEDE